MTQVYHLSRTNSRYKHERENNTYSVLAAFFADLTSTALSILTYIPGIAVAYFMIGFPNEAFPFVMFVYWLVSLNRMSHTSWAGILLSNVDFDRKKSLNIWGTIIA